MPMKRFIAILLVALTSCSISYKFNGASINYDTTKTISIANFPIKAALVYPPLEELFTNSLKNAYTRQTRLQIVSSGDLQLEGEITNYDLTPQAVTENAYASQTRLTIAVRVRFTNTKDPQFNIDNQTFSGYKDFSSTQMLTDVQDELIQQITDELVDQIFNATVANW